MKHSIQRVRHALVRLELTISSITYVTPHMIRVRLAGDELDNFTTMSADDHVKLFFPAASGVIEMRDYSIRRHYKNTNTIDIDVAIHESSDAARWALTARVGDPVMIGGPKGSVVISSDFDWWLLVGDESSLPSIARRVEEQPCGTTVISIVAVRSAAEEQIIQSDAEHQALWVHRPIAYADNPEPILKQLRQLSKPAGDGFIWIAAEAKVARAVRDYVKNVWGHPISRMRASGYWLKGQANTSENIE